MVVVISAFDVPPDADEAFTTRWEAARGAARLHRALRSDVAPRFVEIARSAGAEPAPRFARRSCLYEVVREDGDPDGAGGAVLIDPFEVPAGEDERLMASWERLRALFAARQGYLGTRLHRSVEQAEFRFVAVVRWSSPLMFARTLRQPEVEEASAAMPFPGRPALYLVVDG